MDEEDIVVEQQGGGSSKREASVCVLSCEGRELHTAQPNMHQIVQFTKPRVGLQKIDPRYANIYRLAKLMRLATRMSWERNLLRTIQDNAR